MLRVNQGFFGSISQSAKTSRGSRSRDSPAAVPSGNTAAACATPLVAMVLVFQASKKTISSFHSAVYLYPTWEKKAAIPASRSFGHLSARVPRSEEHTSELQS